MMMDNDYLRINKAGIQIIKESETLRTKAYRCPSGIPTIGWGHIKSVLITMTCSEAEAENWLAEDIEWAERVVRMKVDVPLNENQFSALVSFVFNVGVTNFISSTLLRLLNEGLYESAPTELRKWIYGRDRLGKKIQLPGLVTRRNREAELWSTAA